MTTPSVDLNIVMPYGVTVRSKGAAIPSIVGTHPKQNNGVSLKLPAGPCRIAASWEGAEDMSLIVQNQAVATSRTVATIPGGGVHVPSWSPSGPSRAIRCTSPGRNQPELPALSRFTHSTCSSNRRGGGVGGHPEHRVDHAADKAAHRDHRCGATAQNQHGGLRVPAERYEHGSGRGDWAGGGADSRRPLQERGGKGDHRCCYPVGGDRADLHRNIRQRERIRGRNVAESLGVWADSRAGGNRHRRDYDHPYAGRVIVGVAA